MTVSRDTLAQSGCGDGRKYVSPFRKSQGERTRAALIEAALGFLNEGNFRPEAQQIAAKACRHKSVVMQHFGSIELLYRIIAREYWREVLQAARFDSDLYSEERKRDLAWLIMVGKPRPLS